LLILNLPNALNGFILITLSPESIPGPSESNDITLPVAFDVSKTKSSIGPKSVNVSSCKQSTILVDTFSPPPIALLVTSK